MIINAVVAITFHNSLVNCLEARINQQTFCAYGLKQLYSNEDGSHRKDV
jgi:hypothetical protein